MYTFGYIYGGLSGLCMGVVLSLFIVYKLNKKKNANINAGNMYRAQLSYYDSDKNISKIHTAIIASATSIEDAVNQINAFLVNQPNISNWKIHKVEKIDNDIDISL